MKVTTVTPLQLDDMLLVKVETDAGITGFGECSPMNIPIIASFINEQLTPFVIGKDPFDLELIIEKSFTEKTYKIAGQIYGMALSGIEIALWDIIGKALQKPIYKLIGGAYRTKIPVYASSMRRDISPTNEANRMKNLVEKYGFKAVKVKIGKKYGFDQDESPGRSLAVVEAVRKQLGDDIEIMVDANSCYSPWRAIELGRKLQNYNIFHYEEPCPYLDIDASAKVAKALDVPIALGEQEWSILRFKEMLIKGAADILQPDIVKAGGFIPMKKIAVLAETFGAVVTPHQTKSLGFIANLHFAAATPCVRYYQEYNIESFQTWNKIIKNNLKPFEGHVQVPDAPGLGIEIDEEALTNAKVLT